MGFKNWWNALAFFRDLRTNYSQDMARLGGMIRAVSSQHHVDVIALNARIDQLPGWPAVSDQSLFILF